MNEMDKRRWRPWTADAVDAARKRAQRIGAFSYPMYRSGRRGGAEGSEAQ